ncbi:hypothetical protein [Parvicella tangerina]|uniref:Uncharacterized protein n=1 Tax=Parvicella tangerina TaxID=2829795 RepID=A0A916JML4_9FLAO|nr:hypothetical protein [Parvicella tangerina]CAG5082220.1 hypothetical protein CRYO30217_01844 [Parvicella tangerina]
MKIDELYQKVIEGLPTKELHPLHKAIMEECCENALNNSQKISDLDTLVDVVHLAFLTCNTTLKGTLLGSLEAVNADQVTLNYRDQTFIISRNSPLLD